MRAFVSGLSAFIILFFIASVATALEFSADIESLMNGKVIKGTFYYKTDRRRIEGEAGDKKQISIVRMDKKLVWHIADQQKQYLELPLSEKDMMGLAVVTALGEVKREKLGKEIVHGRSTVKYRIYCKINKNEGIIYQWIDDEYRMPVKTSDQDGKFISEFRNIKPGRQPNGLFELPPGYTKFAIDLTKKQ